MGELLKGTKWFIFFDFIFFGGMSVFEALIPFYTKMLLEGKVLESFIGYGITVLFFLISAYLANLSQWKYNVIFSGNLKKSYFSSLLNMPYAEFSEKPLQSYISFQTNDLEALEKDYLPPMIDVFKSILSFFIFFITIGVTLNFKISIFLVMTTLGFTQLPKMMGKVLNERRESYLNAQKKFFEVYEDLLAGHNQVNRETKGSLMDRHNRYLNKLLNHFFSFGKCKSFGLIVNGASIEFSKLAVFIFIGIQLGQGKIEVSTAAAALGYVEAFAGPIESLFYDIGILSSIRGVKDRVLNQISCYAKTDLLSQEVDDGFGILEFRNIQKVIGNLTLTAANIRLEKGKKYVVLGRNGAGKSTLLKIMAGADTSYKGEVQIDHVTIPKEELHEQVAFLLQREHVYQADVVENVTVFGSYNNKQVVENQFGIKNFQYIDKNAGNRISGGERQLISLERIFNKNREFIFLDEPFAAIDSYTSDILKKEIVRRPETIVIVSHENDAKEWLASFDHIIYVDQGEITVV